MSSQLAGWPGSLCVLRRVALAGTAVLVGGAAARPACAQQIELNVEGEMPGSVRDLIKEVRPNLAGRADLLDVRQALGEAQTAVGNVLRAEGYYGFQLRSEIREEPLAGIVTIVPGQRFTLDPVQVRFEPGAPDSTLRAVVAPALTLKPGEPARSTDIVAQEGVLVTALREAGHADASVEPRDVVVDHATGRVQVTYRLVAGPVVRLGAPIVRGSTRTRQGYVRRAAPFKPGETYSPKVLSLYNSTLQATGAYEDVTISLGKVDKTGLRPVIIELKDGPRRSLAGGVAYSSSEGIGVDVRYTRRQMFSQADELTLTGRLATLEQSAEARLDFPNWRGSERRLSLLTGAGRISTDAYDRVFVRLGAEYDRPYGDFVDVTFGTALDGSRTRGADQPRQWVYALSAYAQAAIDRSDSLLDPERGWRADARVEPIALTGTNTLGLLRAIVGGSVYVPFGGATRFVQAARVRAGTVLGATTERLPPNLRFYAGGGGSARGFGFQSIGPRTSTNEPFGGRSLLELSTETRYDLTRRWGVVAFVDAANVSRGLLPGLGSLRVGGGLGVRFDAGFAPLRLDVATPFNPREGDNRIQVYISIGQAF